MRILLAGILGRIAMFVWTSIAHVALPVGEARINEIPNESVALSAMQSSTGETTGFYVFPHPSGALCCVPPQRGVRKINERPCRYSCPRARSDLTLL